MLERSGGGSAALEPPRRSGRVEDWPWLMHHRSDAKPFSEGQSAGGMNDAAFTLILCLHEHTSRPLGHQMEMARSC